MKAPKLTKRIKYAYPTSPFAVQLGFSKTGCWLVEAVKGEDIPSHCKPLKGFSTYAEAFAYSKAVPGEYDFYCYVGQFFGRTLTFHTRKNSGNKLSLPVCKHL